jgi:hypothetical protein
MQLEGMLRVKASGRFCTSPVDQRKHGALALLKSDKLARGISISMREASHDE